VQPFVPPVVATALATKFQSNREKTS